MDQVNQDMRKYLNLLMQKRRLFITLSLCIMSVIVWGSYFIPKKYEAKSTIFIERNVIEKLVKGIAITPSMDARIKVLRDTMLGRSLVFNVIRKLDLDAQAMDDKELEEMILAFQGKTNITVRNNSLITVSFVDRDPVLARNYVNNLVNEYLEKNIFAKREEAYDASRFLKKQVEFFKGQMGKGEDEIIKFRQEQGIYITMDESSVVNEIKNHEQMIEEIKIRKSELTAIRQSSKKQFVNEKPFSVAMFSTRDIEGIIESLEGRRRQLLIRYTDNYPEVLKIKAEIEAFKNQQASLSHESSGSQRESEISTANPVYQELKQKIMETDAEINSLNAKEAYLYKLIGKKKKELRDIPESKKKLADLEKERDSFKSVYEKLLVRLGQAEVSKQMEIEDKATTFRIIEPAILPTIPVSPNIKKMILAGIMIGFLGAFGIIFLLDNMDDSVRTLDTLKTFGLPVLAIIPSIQNSAETAKEKKRDALLYGFAGLYLLIILVAFAAEMLGLPYIDELINNTFVKQYL